MAEKFSDQYVHEQVVDMKPEIRFDPIVIGQKKNWEDMQLGMVKVMKARLKKGKYRPVDTSPKKHIEVTFETSPENGPKKRRQQNYRAAWEKEYGAWLRCVPNNPRKAKCIVCPKVMVADVTVLKNHAKGKRHIRKLSYGFQYSSEVSPTADATFDRVSTI